MKAVKVFRCLIFFVGIGLIFSSFAQTTEQLEENILFSEEDVETPEQPEVVEQKKSGSDIDKGDLERVDELFQGPKQIPPEHILVVQKRFIQKEGHRGVEYFDNLAGIDDRGEFIPDHSYHRGHFISGNGMIGGKPANNVYRGGG